MGLLGGLIPDGEGLAGSFKPAAEGEVCAVVAGDQLCPVAGVADFIGAQQGYGHFPALHIADAGVLQRGQIVPGVTVPDRRVGGEVVTPHLKADKSLGLVAACDGLEDGGRVLLGAGPLLQQPARPVGEENPIGHKVPDEAALLQVGQDRPYPIHPKGGVAPGLQLGEVRRPHWLPGAAVGGVIPRDVLQLVRQRVGDRAGCAGGGLLGAGDDGGHLVGGEHPGGEKFPAGGEADLHVDLLGGMGHRQEHGGVPAEAEGGGGLAHMGQILFVGLIAPVKPAHPGSPPDTARRSPACFGPARRTWPAACGWGGRRGIPPAG